MSLRYVCVYIYVYIYMCVCVRNSLDKFVIYVFVLLFHFVSLFDKGIYVCILILLI